MGDEVQLLISRFEDSNEQVLIEQLAEIPSQFAHETLLLLKRFRPPLRGATLSLVRQVIRLYATKSENRLNSTKLGTFSDTIQNQRHCQPKNKFTKRIRPD